jgi:hypothetical protein
MPRWAVRPDQNHWIRCRPHRMTSLAISTRTTESVCPTRYRQSGDLRNESQRIPTTHMALMRQIRSAAQRVLDPSATGASRLWLPGDSVWVCGRRRSTRPARIHALASHDSWEVVQRQGLRTLTPPIQVRVLVSQPIMPPTAARIFDKLVAAESSPRALCSHAEVAQFPLFRSKAAFRAPLPTFRGETWWSCFGSAPGCDPGDEGSIPRFTPIVDGSKVPGRAPSVAAGECATPHLRADLAP